VIVKLAPSEKLAFSRNARRLLGDAGIKMQIFAARWCFPGRKPDDAGSVQRTLLINSRQCARNKTTHSTLAIIICYCKKCFAQRLRKSVHFAGDNA